MSPTRSVLLDLDETLIDSQPGVFASCLAALRALGHDPGEALDIKRAIGPPLDDMFPALLRAHGDDRISEAVAADRHHDGESGLLGSEPYPGISGALREMRQGGCEGCGPSGSSRMPPPRSSTNAHSPAIRRTTSSAVNIRGILRPPRQVYLQALQFSVLTKMAPQLVSRLSPGLQA
jgi:beta-phosphoglucomutase-like phosphatase (HAD superfamily)